MRAPGHQPRAETPDIYGCYPRLSEGQMASLAALGRRRPTAPGEVLFREGDYSCDFFVVCAGTVAVAEAYATPEERVIGVHGPGRFLGELSLLTGEAVPVTAVTEEPGQVLDVPTGRLRELVGRDPVIGDLILRAYLARRSVLIGLGAGLRIVGSRFSADARRLRDFASRNRLPHRWIDLETSDWAEDLLRQLGVPAQETPVVILYGRKVLRNPSNAELAEALGLSVPAAQADICDLVVVGAGPAGLAAAVYAASEGLDTVTVDGVAPGGQAATSSRIENYLGFPSGISGGELAERAALQATKFGARITVPAEATAISDQPGHYEIAMGSDAVLRGRMVILASGVRYRKLDVPGMDRFEGANVYYAASQTEAQMCRDDPVAVVGGGNSAGQASLFLAQFARAVQLLVREDDLAENMSRYLADRVGRSDRITVHLHSEVSALLGGDCLTEVVITDTSTGGQRAVPARTMFVFIGAAPHTGWLGSRVALDDRGFILTGNDLGPSPDEARRGRDGQPLPLETSWPGVFAVGDVRSGSIKRVASAVGEGAMAVRMAHERSARLTITTQRERRRQRHERPGCHEIRGVFPERCEHRRGQE